jgi:ribosomal protein S16
VARMGEKRNAFWVLVKLNARDHLEGIVVE